MVWINFDKLSRDTEANNRNRNGRQPDKDNRIGYPIEYDRGGGFQDNNEYSSSRPNWILILGLALIICGALLLTLRSVLFSIMLVTIGVSLFAYWLYTGTRRHESDSVVDNDGVNSDEEEEETTVCTCRICKHTGSRQCLQMKCACCILMRNKQIIGHFNNPV